MNTFDKDLQQHLKQDSMKDATPTASTPKPLAERHRERDEWALQLAMRMIESNNRMETDPEYRKYIQSMTH